MGRDKRVVETFTLSLLLLTASLALAFVLLVPTGHEAPETVDPTSEAAIYQTSRKRTSVRQALAQYRSEMGLVEVEAEKPEEPAVALQQPEPAPPPAPETVHQVVPPIEAMTDTMSPDLQRAIDLIDGGQIHDAVALLEDIVRREPQNEQALVELAMAHLLDLKQPDRAIDYLQRVMEFNPDNRIVMSELVSLYEEQGRGDEGLTFLMNVQQQHPNSEDLSYGIGQMLTLQGRPGEAIPYLEQASRSGDPGAGRVLGELADAYSQGGQPEKAIETYNEAIARAEKELEEKQGRGLPTELLEDRVVTYKRDLTREYIESGRYDAAQALIDELRGSQHAQDVVTSLEEHLQRRRG